MLDIYFVKKVKVRVCHSSGSAVCIEVSPDLESPVVEVNVHFPEQRVYYDFPKTTDGTLWGSRVIMFWW